MRAINWIQSVHIFTQNLHHIHIQLNLKQKRVNELNIRITLEVSPLHYHIIHQFVTCLLFCFYLIIFYSMQWSGFWVILKSSYWVRPFVCDALRYSMPPVFKYSSCVVSGWNFYVVARHVHPLGKNTVALRFINVGSLTTQGGRSGNIFYIR